jgi:hypothetical protein
MTEAEWLSCIDPDRMLRFLQGKSTDRKRRLFGVACCRRMWRALVDPRSRRFVEAHERFADGLAHQADLDLALRPAEAAREALASHNRVAHVTAALGVLILRWDLTAILYLPRIAELAAEVAGALARGDAYERIWQAPGKDHIWRYAQDNSVFQSAHSQERQAQADLLRDIFGDLFQPLKLDPGWVAWNGGTVNKIAREIYDTRAFEQMPILADALEDAGCDDHQFLDHCRGPGLHARGCHVLDLIRNPQSPPELVVSTT